MGETHEPSQEPKKPDRYNPYLKYSSLAFQLVITIGVMGWLGYKLDQYLDFSFPLFMLLFVLAAFTGMLYKLYKTLNKEQVIRFLVLLGLVTLVVDVSAALIPGFTPSFFYETTLLLFLATAVILYILLREHRRTGSLVIPYLASIAFKIILYGMYLFAIIRLQPDEAAENSIFFGILYLSYTLLEIGFLYNYLTRASRH